MTDKSSRPLLQAPLIPSPKAALLALYARRNALWLAIAVVALAAALAIAAPAFTTRANLITMLADVSVTGIAAIGLFVVVLTGGVDLSIGAIAGLAPLLGGLWVGHLGTPLLLALALATGAAIGLISGLLIVVGGLAAFAVTLAVDAVARSVAGSLAGGPGRIGGFVELLPGPDMIVLGVPASLALLVVIAALVATFIGAFRGGRILVAIGSNRMAARAAGLDVTTFGVLPYVVSGVLASVAGLLSVAATPSSPSITEVGGTLTMDGLAAVIIGGASLRGGRGSVVGTLLGVMLVVMIRSGLGLLGIASLWQGCAIGGLIGIGLVADRIAELRQRS